MWAWLSAFLFTEVVECPLYVWALGTGRSWPARLLIAFGASALTHPVVWFVFPAIWYDPAWAGVVPDVALRYAPYGSMVVCAEAFAVLVEAGYLWLARVPQALLWSLGANLASATLGFASRWAFGWP